jgi:PAS domain-containing protein
LRKRAHDRLREDNVTLAPPSEQASKAMRVLYELAASPETAPGALALLHELQVHQVELELQADTLQAAHDELVTALERQVQLYDCAPTAYFTIGADTRVCDANLAGAGWLGLERSALMGHRLDAFVSSPAALHRLVGLVEAGAARSTGLLCLTPSDGPSRTVSASLAADPAGQRFLITLADAPPA